MLLFVLLGVALATSFVNTGCNDDPTRGSWGIWGDFETSQDVVNNMACPASCGTGTKTLTRTRVCCYGEKVKGLNADVNGFNTIQLCEGASTDTNYGGDLDLSCNTNVTCNSADTSFRELETTKCEQGAMTYLGDVGSQGECAALYEASSGEKSAFQMECYDELTGSSTFACYACRNTNKLGGSSCGSRVWVEKKYGWHYGIIAVTSVLGVLILITAAVIDAMGLCADVTSFEDKSGSKDSNMADPLYVPVSDGPICPCCPDFCNLSTMTFAMCMFGFTLGAALNIALEDADEEARSDWLDVIYYPGELWTYALKLLVSPLISLMMLTLPDRINVTSSIGKHTVLFYIFTSSIAACEGLFWVNVIKPGDVGYGFDANRSASVSNSLSELDSLLGIGRKAIPSNLFSALGSSNVLGLITFFLTLGSFIQSPLVDAEWRQVLMDSSKAALKGIMLVIPFIVQFTPFAMVSIITRKIAEVSNLQEIVESVGKYILTVCVAQGLHMFLFYPLLVFFLAGVNPYRYWNQVKRAPLTAFATSSSAATLPVSLDVLRRADVSTTIVDFIAPLGSAINMDGTSCGFPIMCLWIAQLENYDVDAGTQIVLALLAMTCSVGTAPIPNAGIVYVAMLLGSLGGPFEDDDKIANGVAFILIFDWFVDRVETMQNVWSDCCACKIFDSMGYEDLKKVEMNTRRHVQGK